MGRDIDDKIKYFNEMVLYHNDIRIRHMILLPTTRDVYELHLMYEDKKHNVILKSYSSFHPPHFESNMHEVFKMEVKIFAMKIEREYEEEEEI